MCGNEQNVSMQKQMLARRKDPLKNQRIAIGVRKARYADIARTLPIT